MHHGTFSDQFQAFNSSHIRKNSNQNSPFSMQNKVSYPLFEEPSSQEIPATIRMIFDQDSGDESHQNKRNQGEYYPQNLKNNRGEQHEYDPINATKPGMPQHGLLIPSFSQVIHGFTPINPNSGTSTPGSRSTPTNSKRGVQSNSGKKYSNSPRVFNKQINEDINLIERIEGLLTTIADNYNRYCPVCQGYIELKKSNSQNICAYFSRTKQKYYLTHFDCYLKSSSNFANAKIRSLSEVATSRCLQLQTSGLLDTSDYFRSDKRAYIMTVEGYHPLSSYLFFNIEKPCFAIEHANNGDQLLYLNLANKSTSIFEPNLLLIPYNEFRCVLTIHLTQSTEEPYQHEFMVDMSEHKLNSETKMKNLEISFKNQEGNSVRLGVQAVFDPNNEYVGSVNYKIPLPDTNPSSPSVRPDFARATFYILKYLMIDLPLKRPAPNKQQELSMKQAESNKLPDSPKSDHSGHSKRLDDSVSPRALFRSRNQLALNPQSSHFNVHSQRAGESTFSKIYGPNSKNHSNFAEQQQHVVSNQQQQYPMNRNPFQQSPQFEYPYDNMQSDDVNEGDNEEQHYKVGISMLKTDSLRTPDTVESTERSLYANNDPAWLKTPPQKSLRNKILSASSNNSSADVSLDLGPRQTQEQITPSRFQSPDLSGTGGSNLTNDNQDFAPLDNFSECATKLDFDRIFSNENKNLQQNMKIDFIQGVNQKGPLPTSNQVSKFGISANQAYNQGFNETFGQTCNPGFNPNNFFQVNMEPTQSPKRVGISNDMSQCIGGFQYGGAMAQLPWNNGSFETIQAGHSQTNLQAPAYYGTGPNNQPFFIGEYQKLC